MGKNLILPMYIAMVSFLGMGEVKLSCSWSTARSRRELVASYCLVYLVLDFCLSCTEKGLLLARDDAMSNPSEYSSPSLAA